MATREITKVTLQNSIGERGVTIFNQYNNDSSDNSSKFYRDPEEALSAVSKTLEGSIYFPCNCKGYNIISFLEDGEKLETFMEKDKLKEFVAIFQKNSKDIL